VLLGNPDTIFLDKGHHVRFDKEKRRDISLVDLKNPQLASALSMAAILKVSSSFVRVRAY